MGKLLGTRVVVAIISTDASGKSVGTEEVIG
jgi:hypothetical protein